MVKFSFQIGKKPLIFVEIVYSENRLLRILSIVSVAIFVSICSYRRQSVQLSEAATGGEVQTETV